MENCVHCSVILATTAFAVEIVRFRSGWQYSVYSDFLFCLFVQLLEKTGVVHSVLDCGDVRVECDNRVWTINPSSLVRVREPFK